MTLGLAVVGRKSIWLCIDRRLTFPDSVRDDGVKMLEIAAIDGEALIAYSGLGSSINGTEPSDWMNDVLRNKYGLKIEQQLQILAGALGSEMPRHLATLAGQEGHYVVAPAIVGGETRLYMMGLTLDGPALVPKLTFTRWFRNGRSGPSPWFGVVGSGSNFARAALDNDRDLMRIVGRVEEGKLDPLIVSDRLAAINRKVSTKDRFVSPDCVVVWRQNGGAHQFYDARGRTDAVVLLPSIGNGIDVRDIVEARWPKMLEAMKDGGNVPIKLKDAIFNSAATQAAVDAVNARPARKL